MNSLDAAYCDRCHVYSVVCASAGVCVLVTRMYSAKMAEPIEMPFAELTLEGPRNRALRSGKSIRSREW